MKSAGGAFDLARIKAACDEAKSNARSFGRRRRRKVQTSGNAAVRLLTRTIFMIGVVVLSLILCGGALL